MNDRHKTKVLSTKLAIEALILSQDIDTNLKLKLIECAQLNFRSLEQAEPLSPDYYLELSICRKGIMDLFELLLGSQPQWGYVRSKLLFSFGDRCLGQIS